MVRKNYERSRSNTPEMVEQRMSLFTPGLDLADCDLVIEAVFETMEVKKDVFSKVNSVVRPDAILASNTSYLNIDEMAGLVDTLPGVTVNRLCASGLEDIGAAPQPSMPEISTLPWPAASKA